MQAKQIQQFLFDYFHINQCEVIENTASSLTVKLTPEIDKELMNRPFYWHYIEQTGGIAESAQLTLHTNWQSPEISGEKIHFGSPRLQQIFQSTKKLSSHVRLYQSHQGALFPWLCLNQTISYQSDQQKASFLSIGLNLINGNLVSNFHEKINHLPLQVKISDMSYTLAPLITIASGIKRIEDYLQNIINEENEWVEQANIRWQKAIRLLDNFYIDIDDEQYQTELQALQRLYQPRVVLTMINGGMFYLANGDF